MFDADTVALIAGAPALDGLDLEDLPQRLTNAYASIVASRVRMREIAQERILPDSVAAVIGEMRRLAFTYEAFVSALPERADRAAAAFVAGAAQSWDSGYLVEPGDQFEVTLIVEGVYDYFCTPHEMAGMVGRIIVGQPLGPGTLPFDYFKGDPAARDWRVVPKAARAAFPPIEAVMNERVVRAA